MSAQTRSSFCTCLPSATDAPQTSLTKSHRLSQRSPETITWFILQRLFSQCFTHGGECADLALSNLLHGIAIGRAVLCFKCAAISRQNRRKKSHLRSNNCQHSKSKTFANCADELIFGGDFGEISSLKSLKSWVLAEPPKR